MTPKPTQPLIVQGRIMTREIKLALILGFALVLTVGILVADHFSTAQNASLAAIDPAESQHSPVQRFVDRSRDFITNRPEPLAQVTTGTDETPEAHAETQQTQAPQQPRSIVMGGPTQPDTDPQQQTPTINAGERLYTVKPGESLWGIAQAIYGDGARWRDIAERNQGRINTDGGVEKGTVLIIPNAPSSAPRSTPPQAPATYTVKPGDTLSEIAQQTLGTASRWKEILELNADKISAADEIYAGLVLKLPR